MSNFTLYMIGTIIVVAALAWGAVQLGVPQIWIIIGALIVIGLGIMGGVSKTRQKENPDQ